MSLARPVLVRPRGGKVSHPLDNVLIEAGVDFAAMQIIAEGMPDSLAIREIISRPVSVLIVPFHVHTDMQGNEVNGLELCRQLDESHPALQHTPIIMPVRTGSRSTLRLKATLGETAEAYARVLGKQVLIAFEDEVSERSFPAKVRDHISKHRDARSQTSGVFDLPTKPPV